MKDVVYFSLTIIRSAGALAGFGRPNSNNDRKLKVSSNINFTNMETNVTYKKNPTGKLSDHLYLCLIFKTRGWETELGKFGEIGRFKFTRPLVLERDIPSSKINTCFIHQSNIMVVSENFMVLGLVSLENFMV